MQRSILLLLIFFLTLFNLSFWFNLDKILKYRNYYKVSDDIIANLVNVYFYQNKENYNKLKKQLSKYTIKVKSLITAILLVETSLQPINLNKNVQNYYILVPEIFYQKITNDLVFDKEKFKSFYQKFLQDKYNHFYCNIWNIIPNWSDIIFILKNKDISKNIEKQYLWKRNYIWQKISICKMINKNFKHNIKNLYRILNSKVSSVGAILANQFMPNTLYAVIKDKKNLEAYNIDFYFETILRYLSNWNVNYYIKELENINFNECRFNMNKKSFCWQLKKDIFRYNHSNTYVKRILIIANFIDNLQKSGFFARPVMDLFLILNNTIYKIKGYPYFITQWFKNLKHRWIDIAPLPFDEIKKWFLNINFTFNKKYDCYFIPYNINSILSKNIGNTIFCLNDSYGILFWHLKNIWKWIKLEKIRMNKDLFFKYRFILTWKQTNIEKIKIDNLYIYKMNNINKNILIWYVGNTGLNSFGEHLHFDLVNLKTRQFLFKTYNLWILKKIIKDLLEKFYYIEK